MTLECKICNFLTTNKFNFHRHLKTKKHINNTSSIPINLNVSNNLLMNQNEPTMNQNEPTMNQNEPTMNQNEPTIFNENELKCQYCNKSFNTVPSKRRHEIHRCKENPNIIVKNGTKINITDRKKLVSLIDTLFDKHAGDTITNANNTNSHNNINNSTNNTIILNNYGQEDISHITDKMKMNLIKLPFDSVQKMIEQVHFSKKKPENRNIAIPNKKEQIIKVYKNDKWAYKDRKEIINDLIHINYDRLDEYYEGEAKEKLSELHNKRYMKYQHRFDKDDKQLIDVIKKEVELLVLSSNL